MGQANTNRKHSKNIYTMHKKENRQKRIVNYLRELVDERLLLDELVEGFFSSSFFSDEASGVENRTLEVDLEGEAAAEGFVLVVVVVLAVLEVEAAAALSIVMPEPGTIFTRSLKLMAFPYTSALSMVLPTSV